MGWDHQLKNEIGGVNLGYQRSWRGLIPMKILGFDFDLTPHMPAELSETYTLTPMQEQPYAMENNWY